MANGSTLSRLPISQNWLAVYTHTQMSLTHVKSPKLFLARHSLHIEEFSFPFYMTDDTEIRQPLNYIAELGYLVGFPYKSTTVNILAKLPVFAIVGKSRKSCCRVFHSTVIFNAFGPVWNTNMICLEI